MPRTRAFRGISHCAPAQAPRPLHLPSRRSAPTPPLLRPRPLGKVFVWIWGSWGCRVLRYLFMDVNSYFASVEQQDRNLSGPVGVVPMAGVDTTCIIAASYEAKAWGVNTGTAVHEAKKLCPSIKLLEARP